MKINIGNHEFTELWDGVLYKALSDYPNVSDNEMKDITMAFYRLRYLAMDMGKLLWQMTNLMIRK